MSTLTIDAEGIAARLVSVSDKNLAVELADGRTLSVPLTWFPRLLHGTPKERRNWQLIGGGEGIHWPDLDEDISVEGLVAGRCSAESQPSLQRWLNRRANFRPHTGTHKGPREVSHGVDTRRRRVKR